MDQKKREELSVRRAKLQEEIRLKDLRKRVMTQITYLEKLGHSYTVYYEVEHFRWINSHVKVRRRDGYYGIHGDFQIDVDDSTALNSIGLKEEEIGSVKFKMEVESLISDDSVLVSFTQGGDVELEFSLKAFLENPTVFFSGPETWLLTSDKKWVVEYIWEQGVIRVIQLEGSTPILVTKIIVEEE